MIIPVLRIFDESVAKAFYVDFLGFKVNFEHRFDENFPLYIEILKDNLVIHLSEHHGDACPGAAIMLLIADVRGFQEQLLSQQYKYSRPGVEETEWGTLEMAMTDPFGNRLTFFEHVTESD
ncbi:MAG: VOC family protein [Acidobacteria bacterium]|nr:VOC family protein [Acidobacteriota bacterium]